MTDESQRTAAHQLEQVELDVRAVLLTLESYAIGQPPPVPHAAASAALDRLEALAELGIHAVLLEARAGLVSAYGSAQKQAAFDSIEFALRELGAIAQALDACVLNLNEIPPPPPNRDCCRHVADGSWPAIAVLHHTLVVSRLALDTRLCAMCSDAVSALVAGLMTDGGG